MTFLSDSLLGLRSYSSVKGVLSLIIAGKQNGGRVVVSGRNDVDLMRIALVGSTIFTVVGMCFEVLHTAHCSSIGERPIHRLARRESSDTLWCRGNA